MKCQKCDLEQDRPLETYDGRLWCVKCHAPLTGTAPAFAFTEESEAFYNLSEICFGDYLMKASQYVTVSGEPAKKEGVPTEELRELRDKAVEYCSRSAAAGDPRAVVRMGYYLDRDYAETGRSAELRCKMAADHYKSVCCCADTVDRLPRKGGAVGMTEEEWQGLRLRAAALMMKMLASCPAGGIMQRAGYADLPALRKEIALATGVNVDIPARVPYIPDRTAEAEKVLRLCTSSSRAPLVAVFAMTAAELKKLFSEPFVTGMVPRVTMDLLLDDGSGLRVLGLREPQGIADAIAQVKGKGYLRVINTLGKHALGGYNVGRVRSLVRKDTAYTEDIILGTKGSCTLYDDDIMVQLGAGVRGMKAAADKLSEYIRSAGGNQ